VSRYTTESPRSLANPYEVSHISDKAKLGQRYRWVRCHVSFGKEQAGRTPIYTHSFIR